MKRSLFSTKNLFTSIEFQIYSYFSFENDPLIDNSAYKRVQRFQDLFPVELRQFGEENTYKFVVMQFINSVNVIVIIDCH